MSARMNASRYPITMTLEAPLHHGAFGGDTGNAVLFRRVPLAASPASPGVPAVSGNALRGALRRIVMRDLFTRCGLHVGAAEVPPIAWDRLYGALANGGHLTQAETKTDPVTQRALRHAIPALSVFGAALYSYMMPGRVSVGWLWPVCTETVAAGLCTAQPGAPLHDAEELVAEISQVRHIDRDQQNPALSGVTPMPVTIEALVPGVVLQGSLIALKSLPPVEVGVLGYALNELVSLGGKSGSGFGRVQVQHECPSEGYDAWLSDATIVKSARETLIALAASMA
ncbi:MAG: hypothetical protein JWM95_1715 [Gemmatimonadetes bacterium]|nr:hypothetical protein [Gemmatimonadota bacterium]